MNSIDLLNAMRANASPTYQDRIPEATRDNLATIGNLLTSVGFEDVYSEWVGLIGKVALTIFSNRAYNNPLKLLKKGRLPLGSTLEEIFIQMAKPVEFDPEGTDALKRVIPDGVSLYHSKDFFHTYTASISRAQVRNYFTSDGTLDRFFTETINSLYSGYELDEYLTIKELLVGELPNAYTLAMKPLTDEATSKTFVRQLRQTILDLGFASDKYNPLGVLTHTPRENLVLFIDTKTYARIGVDVLASAFNMEEVNYNIRIIPLDNLTYDIGQGADNSCFALLVDSEAIKVYDKQIFMDRQHNGKGAFDTFFLHVNELVGFSHVGNIVAFCADPRITRNGDVIREGYIYAGGLGGYVELPAGAFGIEAGTSATNPKGFLPSIHTGAPMLNVNIYFKGITTAAGSGIGRWYNPDTGEIVNSSAVATTPSASASPTGFINHMIAMFTSNKPVGAGDNGFIIGFTLTKPAPSGD